MARRTCARVAALRRPALALALAAAAAALTPALARAAIIERISDSDNVTFIAASGEHNDLTLTLSADGTQYLARDAGASLNARAGCAQVDPQNVTCPARTNDRVKLVLGDQDDALHVDLPQRTTSCGGLGNDVMTGGRGPDFLYGEEGDDTLASADGNDVLRGSADCDGKVFDAPPGNDTMDGGPGTDRLDGAAGSDVLVGGDGSDSLHGFAGDDKLSGGAGNDVLDGADGADTLSGDDGNDRLCGGAGNDDESAGAGDDRVGITIRVADTTAPGGARTLPDLGDDRLDGGPGDDLLAGGPGPYLFSGVPLTAHGPDDTPNGADTLVGGDGTDTVTYDNRTLAARISLDGARNDGADGENDMIAPDVEEVVGSLGNDTIVGSDAADVISGGGGNDVIDGGLGDDSLFGGTADGGADRIDGGAGNDHLDGQGGDDRLSGGPGTDTIAGSGGNDTISGGDDGDMLSGGPGIDVVSGDAGDDFLLGAATGLIGSDGGDTLDGGPGNDGLDGGPGDDRLIGGPGLDLLSGGPGTDTAVYLTLRPLRITLDDRFDDGAAGEGDNVDTTTENVRGGGGGDTIAGEVGANNALFGGGGDDYLDGGGGADTLHGGGGADVLRSHDDARDVLDCGPGHFDFAIRDRHDDVQGCERVVRPGGRPRRGRSVAVSGPGGAARFAPPGHSRAVPLRDRLALPMGTRIASSTTAHFLSAGRKSATVAGGVTLRRGPRGAVDLSVVRPAGCSGGPGAPGRARATIATRGGYRTAGGPLVAKGRGRWRVTVTCSTVTVAVLSGHVSVKNTASGRSTALGHGQQVVGRAEG